MDQRAIKILLNKIQSKLNEVAGVAKAAKACADSSAIDKGISVSMDIDQLLYRADRLGDAT